MAQAQKLWGSFSWCVLLYSKYWDFHISNGSLEAALSKIYVTILYFIAVYDYVNLVLYDTHCRTKSDKLNLDFLIPSVIMIIHAAISMHDWIPLGLNRNISVIWVKWSFKHIQSGKSSNEQQGAPHVNTASSSVTSRQLEYLKIKGK